MNENIFPSASNSVTLNMNDTSVWAVDNLDQPERSSTPLYPSVAQRISEWTSLTSEQSRLKSLSYNDSVQDKVTSPTQVHTSPSHSAVFSSPPRKYSSNGGDPSFGGSSSSLDHSMFSLNGATNIAHKNHGSIMMVDDGVRYAQSCQTEILPNFYAHETRNIAANNKNHYQINIQMLAAELDASRDLNRKLSMQLAKTERDLQSLKIQQDLQIDKLDAVVASRVSEILNRLCDTDFNGKQRSSFSSLAPSPPTLDNFGYVSDQEVKRLLVQLNKPSLTADDIAKNCNAMLSYVKSKGDCRLSVRNERFLNDVHSEQMQSISSEKVALENQIDILTDRLKSLEYENSTLKIRAEESRNANVLDTKELRDDLAQLSYENDKLKHDLTELSKKSMKSSDVINLEAEKNELQRQLEREQIEKQELFLQLNTINSRLAQAQYDDAQVDRFRMEKENLTKELAEIYDQIRAMRERNETNSITFNEQLVRMRNENEDLRKVCETLINDRDKISEELSRSENENRKLNVEVDRLSLKSNENSNISDLKSKFDEISHLKEKAEKDTERLREKYERQEAKWEREAYDLRRRYQEADEEKFQLQEELKLQKMEFQNEIESIKKQIETQISVRDSQSHSDKIDTEVIDDKRVAEIEEQLKQTVSDKKQLETKNDELKRLVTVLRRKLGAATTT